ncbi:hypothetical protein [Chryseolinea soli]|uniref:SH3 domain-containing protein n=1 Tax=Chryseolinea soli TaxID=2321403 RepID=A0A385SRQ4_9BACT|nr:hypothetical protein [Chryseolinea soli]AYB34473.1 hypothetical protein D4L85_29565 [Chryseolinea soli]
MRICLLIIFFIGLHLAEGRAQARFKTGDTLYVWARNKLQVRDRPNGKIIGSLSYGDQVVLQGYSESGASIQALPTTIEKGKENDKVMVSGSYVEVSFKKTKGYVFDAYLLRYPPLESKEPLPEYFARTFGLLKTLKEERGTENYSFLRYVYKNGISYESQTGEKSYESVVIIPDLSIAEAIVFCSYLFHLESYLANAYTSHVVKVVDIRNQGTGSYLYFAFDLESFRIEKTGSYIIITSEGVEG